MTKSANTPNASPATGRILYGCFCGTRGLEIGMTLEEALSCSHQGSCDADVAVLVRRPAIVTTRDAA